MKDLEIRLIKTFEDEYCVGVVQFGDKIIVATDRRVYEIVGGEFNELQFVVKPKEDAS